jgi:hypothetical protein
MKPLVRSLLCAVVLALPVVGSVQPASAQLVDLTCPVSVTLGFSPGMGLFFRPQTVTGVLRAGTDLFAATPCTSLTGVPYHGGTGAVTGAGTFGCVGGALSGTAVMTWDNGDTSTIAWTLTAIPPLPIFSATVVLGELTGSTVLALGIPTGFTGSCILAPWTSLSGVGVATLIRL